jgi:hypothetical protein
METIFMWQARNGDGEIYLYENKPYISDNGNQWIENTGVTMAIGQSFDRVHWEDSLIEIKQDIVECVMTEPPTIEEMLIEFEENGNMLIAIDCIQNLVDEAFNNGYHECLRQKKGG